MSQVFEPTSLQLAELALLNETAPGPHRIAAVRQDGRHIIADDLLGDCGPGQTYEHFADFLHSLAAETTNDQPITPAAEPRSKRKGKK